jgi:uncharacterized protein (TIGR02147 family)
VVTKITVIVYQNLRFTFTAVIIATKPNLNEEECAKVTSLDYREFLREKINERIEQNPQLSMRAIAKKTGVSHSLLSLVLSGKKNLSHESASQFASRLGFSATDEERFLLLVDYTLAKDPSYKLRLRERIENLGGLAEGLQLTLDKFKMMGEWYHAALLELIRTEEYAKTPTKRWMAERLGIEPAIVEVAMDRMERLGLIEKEDSIYRRVDSYVDFDPGIPNENLRRYHRQFIEKAMAAIEEQTYEQRSISGLTFAIDPSEVPMVNDMIKKFKNGLEKKLKSKKFKSVYQINFQFFELTKTRRKL